MLRLLMCVVGAKLLWSSCIEQGELLEVEICAAITVMYAPLVTGS